MMMMLTLPFVVVAVERLLRTYDIDATRIGRLEVGTETLTDKSKAVKTSLMRLFAAANNHDVEGIDSKNACYGGTAALFNSIAWLESSAWDGRLAMVVMGDIAVYAAGPARPTGGAGAVALLLGPDAPLVLEGPLRASYMADTHDFYKPHMGSEFPIVNGPLSLRSYLKAFGRCYTAFQAKAARLQPGLPPLTHFVFHAPYGKLVQKAFARKVLLDGLSGQATTMDEADPVKWQSLAARLDASPGCLPAAELEQELELDKATEVALLAQARPLFEVAVAPSLGCSQQLGNLYCASLYAGLVSLVAERRDELVGRRLGLFSYGSGLAATFFSVRVVASVADMADRVQLAARLAARIKKSPVDFAAVLAQRQALARAPASYSPVGSVDDLVPGTWYLHAIDALGCRSYRCK